MEKENSHAGSSGRSSSSEEHTKHEFVDESQSGDQPKKTWYQRLDPFMAGGIPPVPDYDAGLIPDLQANWWSKLTWGWMAPLMLVRIYYFSYFKEVAYR